MIPHPDLKARTIGLNFSSGGMAEFCLWAPLAQEVELIVNDKKILLLQKNDDGYWILSTDNIKPGDYYRIKLSKDKILPDPASLSQPEGVHGASQAYDLNSFEWYDTAWKGPENNQMILYELHTGTFTREGDFNGIAGKLEYLRDLGITAIEIMPVAQFPGSRNWGYDGVYPFAVQNTYGGAYGLQNLVNKCHNMGLAVVLDVVYNHLGPEGNYLNEFGPYFTDKYKTPWGMAINFDDAWCDGVRRYYIENMLMWFRDFHIDALRIDAVHAIRDFSPKHIMQELHENASELEKLTGRKYLLIAETDLNDTRFIKPVDECGYGLDMQWCDEFHHAFHALATGEKQGYYSDFGEIWQAVKTLNSAYVYDDIYSHYRKKTYGTKTTGLRGDKFVVFIQNHDQTGNRMMGDRIANLVEPDLLRLITGAMFVSPFVPLIFMGEEYAENLPFLYFTSHSDKELIELVRKGRAEEFKDFIDESKKVPDPHLEELFQKSKLSFNITGKRESFFAYYKELIRLKKTHPVCKSYDRNNMKATESETKTLVLTRKTDDHQLIAVLNFDKKKISFRLPESGGRKLHVLIDSSEKRWGGKNETGTIITEGNEISIGPSSIVVLSDFTV